MLVKNLIVSGDDQSPNSLNYFLPNPQNSFLPLCRIAVIVAKRFLNQSKRRLGSQFGHTLCMRRSLHFLRYLGFFGFQLSKYFCRSFLADCVFQPLVVAAYLVNRQSW
ncbi:hypothetical protein ETAA8_45630 [Anatilimnocola aggregata]|uniref:Uncharacterized protein n=1 Tax=Anatilimnocola aggregata TaxID=2528021 RepID=A0A517YGV4_9BACT|nr:hypothetical protein ETAA8_45630 [Anatilimnocola aggregata]